LNSSGRIKEYPWERGVFGEEKEMIQELKEGQWVMVHGSMGELVLEYNKIERR